MLHVHGLRLTSSAWLQASNLLRNALGELQQAEAILQKDKHLAGEVFQFAVHMPTQASVCHVRSHLGLPWEASEQQLLELVTYRLCHCLVPATTPVPGLTLRVHSRH